MQTAEAQSDQCFNIRKLESKIVNLATCKFPLSLLVSVAESYLAENPEEWVFFRKGHDLSIRSGGQTD